MPTTAWRRERRLRTGEYHHPSHHHHHASPAGSSASSVRATSPSSSPPPVAHGQISPNAVATSTTTQLHSNAHQISMMMAAAAAVGMRPLCESTNRPSPSPVPSHVANSMHLGNISHSEVVLDMDDAPLDMSVSSSLKLRNSPPPPYREPLPGSQFVSSLPRPSVITQAPPKRDTRDSILIANRENDNRSSGKYCKFPRSVIVTCILSLCVFLIFQQNRSMNTSAVLWAMSILRCLLRSRLQTK